MLYLIVGTLAYGSESIGCIAHCLDDTYGVRRTDPGDFSDGWNASIEDFEGQGRHIPLHFRGFTHSFSSSIQASYAYGDVFGEGIENQFVRVLEDSSGELGVVVVSDGRR